MSTIPLDCLKRDLRNAEEEEKLSEKDNVQHEATEKNNKNRYMAG